MTTIHDIMALVNRTYGVFKDAEETKYLRIAIEQALLQAHKQGFDAALRPGSVPDAQPVTAFEKWCADHPNDTIKPDWIAWQAATLAERERCAKVCEGMVRMDRHGYPAYPSSYAEQCAAAIKGTK